MFVVAWNACCILLLFGMLRSLPRLIFVISETQCPREVQDYDLWSLPLSIFWMVEVCDGPWASDFCPLAYSDGRDVN